METFVDFLEDPQLKDFISKNKEFYKYISEIELRMIFDAMDKTDYTCTGVDRWLDLEQILNKIIGNTNTLKSIKLVSQKETFPPQNLYHIMFEKSENQ